MIVVDFETGPIAGPTSHVPPAPVGVAISYEATKPHYLAWGHPTHNNCAQDQAVVELLSIWRSNERVCFHNAPFDLAVAEKWLGLEWLPAHRIEDTLLLAYLYDSQLPTLSLKPLCHQLLGMPPEEQDEVREWLISHGIVRKGDRGWGAHIGKAPGNLVGRYAIGDVLRTRKLYDYLEPKVRGKGMGEAYDRERNLLGVLHRNTKQGVRVDRAGMEGELGRLSSALYTCDVAIRNDLGAPGLNVDANIDLANALDKAGKVREWAHTETGQRSTSRENLVHCLNDPTLAHLIAYRGQLATLTGTFLAPWLTLSEQDGRLHPNWNQVRGEHGGTRTGRLSCSEPNLQNPPTVEKMVQPPAEGLPTLPNLRKFFLPEPSHVYVSADFHSQEIRILGHYAEGRIKEIYNADPEADVHQKVIEMVKWSTGKDVSRKAVKVVVFSLIYGAGARLIASRLGITEQEASDLIGLILDALTGVRSLRDDIQRIARNGNTITTWGGRVIRAPGGKNGVRHYALLNYLIQGSAADQTKQALVAYNNAHAAESSRFLLTVHDEICISVDEEEPAAEITKLVKAMESGKFDLPMRATVSVGNNWGEMKPWKP